LQDMINRGVVSTPTSGGRAPVPAKAPVATRR
jgi:hypothetical protein